MRKSIIYSFILLAVSFLMFQCVGLEPAVLYEKYDGDKSCRVSIFSAENALDYKSEAVVIDNPKLVDGVFEDFQNELVGWWSSGDILKFSKGNNFLQIDANKTASGYPQIGCIFEPKDFSNTPVIRVKMRIEGSESAKVRLDLKDINDASTNAIIVSNEVLVSNEYQEYYFDFNNKFKQSWPNVAEVDPRQISGMIFFVSPGDKNFKGKILIKEIYVMANKDGSGVVSKEILLDDFSGDINYWWGCDKERVILSKEGKSLFVRFISGQWSCFGMTFDPMNISSTPVIKLRIKAQSLTRQPNVDVVAYFTDTNNKTTNAINKPQKVIIGNDYVDYFYDYKDNMASSDGPFDPKSTQGIIVFINTLGAEVFNGSISLDEVVFLPLVPNYVSKRVVLSKPFVSDSTWIKGNTISILDDFKNDNKTWISSNDKVSMSLMDNNILKIFSNGVGPEWEEVSKKVQSVNFLENPVLKVRVKADGNLNPVLRMVLTDNMGNISNARPAEEVIERSTEFVDYFFDFTGRFEQRFPEIKNINPMAIDKISLYINGGGELYTGSIYIDEIRMITLNDYLKIAK